MFKDLRYAYRTLRKNPGFALTAIVSIALAIGANSAIFSFQDALLLRPLAVEKPADVVTLSARTPTGGFGGFSYPDFKELRDKNRSFSGLVTYRLIPAGFARDERTQPQFKPGLVVSGNFFELLGIRPYLGRGFLPDEDQVPGRDAVVVLAYDFWKNELAGDRSIVGRHVRIGTAGGLDFTVIGVAPESFTGMDLFVRPAFYVPAMMAPRVLGVSDDTLSQRDLDSSDDAFYIKGRLKAGVSLPAADADVTAITRVLAETYPNSNRGHGVSVRTEMQSRLDANSLLGGVVGAVFGVMIVILLIACANVMNLMLSRGLARSREMAIRLAIGARRSSLLRQLMAENLMIAGAGGIVGLLIAAGAVEFFSSWELPGDAPIKLSFQLDQRVLFFTLVVAVISAILFGLIPAFRSTRTDLTNALKAGDQGGGRNRLFGRNTLLTIQITGSIVLIMAAMQMYRNTMKALTDPPGFTRDHRLTVRFDPGVAGYNAAQTEQFYRTLIEKARQLPGIQSAALTAGLPFTTDGLGVGVVPEGFELPQGVQSARIQGNVVDENYFDTFGVSIIAGRSFRETDQANSPKVAIVNDAFAKRFFGGNALGKRVRIDNDAWLEIVGVSVTGKYFSVAEPPAPYIYVPFRQRPRTRMTLIAATSRDPAAFAPAVRDMIRSIDPNMPIFALRPMDEIFERNAAAQIRVFNVVFSSAGVMGFLLALVGLYAVVSYQVTRKTKEIGIRMALGAERFQVMQMILRQAATVAVVGIGTGLVLSILVRPALLVSMGRPRGAGLLSGFDPLLFGLLPLALLMVAMFASAIPARRAFRVDPQKALRQE